MNKSSVFVPLLVFLFIASVIPLAGQTNGLKIGTYRAEFSRKVEEPGEETRTINGILYFIAPETLIFDIWYPNDQMMIFKGQRLTIYYPEEERGFLFFSRQKQILTFSQTFLGLVKNDFGLSDAGFTIKGKSEKGGVLLTYWNPPRSMQKSFGRMVVGSKNGRPFYLEGSDNRGNLLFRVTYVDFVSKGTELFPTKVVMKKYGKEGNTSETIEYFNQRINTTLPGKILNFSIPPGAELKEVQW